MASRCYPPDYTRPIWKENEMTTEKKEKANPEYQAINQTNSKVTLDALMHLRGLQAKADSLRKSIMEIAPELTAELAQTEIDIANLQDKKHPDSIHAIIETHGSYQDSDAGLYALAYEKKSAQYNGKAFRLRYPEHAPAVLTEVNVNVLKGLIRGKVLDQTELEQEMPVGSEAALSREVAPAVITYKITKVYEIK